MARRTLVLALLAAAALTARLADADHQPDPCYVSCGGAYCSNRRFICDPVGKRPFTPGPQAKCYGSSEITTCGRFGPANDCAFAKTPALAKCLASLSADSPAPEPCYVGCHPDICQPTPLAPGQPCTTEYRIGSECYRNRTLTTCGRFGPNNQCAFTKTPDLDKCLRDARARFESRVVGDATEKDQGGAGDDASKKTDDKTPPSMDALVQMLQQLIQIMQQGGSK